MSARETFNAISHGLGVLLALAGTFILVVPPLQRGEPVKATVLAVFGLALVLTYAVSTLFHSTHGEARARFRRLDRTAIYVLIMGGYAPICLLALPPHWGLPLLAVTGCVAAVGVVLEVFTTSGGGRSSVALYLILGWMSIAVIKPLAAALGPGGLAWLVLGGLLYTVGALALRFRLIPLCHEVWHVVVLAASGCHFVLIFRYVS